jgi:hypothetical protein
MSIRSEGDRYRKARKEMDALRQQEKCADRALVHGSSVSIPADVLGTATVAQSTLRGECKVRQNAYVIDSSLYGTAVHQTAVVESSTLPEWSVGGNAFVSGICDYSGLQVQITGKAFVTALDHVRVIGPVGSVKRTVTIYRTRGGQCEITAGCWSGTPEDLMARIKGTPSEWIGHRSSTDGPVLSNQAPLWRAQYTEICAMAVSMRARWSAVSVRGHWPAK